MTSKRLLSDDESAALRPVNNPEGEPTGHFTGRCMRCGSSNLWDDNTTYGCDCCGAWWTAVEPRVVPNASTPDVSIDEMNEQQLEVERARLRRAKVLCDQFYADLTAETKRLVHERLSLRQHRTRSAWAAVVVSAVYAAAMFAASDVSSAVLNGVTAVIWLAVALVNFRR